MTSRNNELVNNNRSQFNANAGNGDAFGSDVTVATEMRLSGTYVCKITDTAISDTNIGRDTVSNGIKVIGFQSGFNGSVDQAIVLLDNITFINQDYAINLSEVDARNCKIVKGDHTFINTNIQNTLHPITGLGNYYELPYSNHHTDGLKSSFSLSPDKSTILISEVDANGIVSDVIQTYPIKSN